MPSVIRKNVFSQERRASLRIFTLDEISLRYSETWYTSQYLHNSIDIYKSLE